MVDKYATVNSKIEKYAWPAGTGALQCVNLCWVPVPLCPFAAQPDAPCKAWQRLAGVPIR